MASRVGLFRDEAEVIASSQSLRINAVPVPVPSIVVIGASAGGVQALLELVPELPRDLPAAVFIVIHIGNRQSVLPEILGRAGSLPAKFGEHGERFEVGRIYVAPPDHHMLIYEGSIVLTRGPRENLSRPAIDPLFRTAAHAYLDRVIGVVLSGALSDGAAGLVSIKTHGGIAMVQDPRDAVISGMPESALRLIDADYVAPVGNMAEIIVELVGSFGRKRSIQMTSPANSGQYKKSFIQEDINGQARDGRSDELTLFTCPDCGGSLWQADEGSILRFECHVGHALNWEALLDQKSEQVEFSLWASVRLLVERATLRRQIAQRLERDDGPGPAVQLRVDADLDEQLSQSLRDLLEALPSEAPAIERA